MLIRDWMDICSSPGLVLSSRVTPSGYLSTLIQLKIGLFITALQSSFVQKVECNSGSLGGPPVIWMGIWMLMMLEWCLISVGLQMGSPAALGMMMMHTEIVVDLDAENF
jgi:hypothetical protein